MKTNECDGDHRFFVASVQEVPISPNEGKVVLIVVCTACGEPRVSEHKIKRINPHGIV